jgi:hypothetical protein
LGVLWVTLALLFPAPVYGGSFFKNCAELLKIWIQAPSISDARIREFLPVFHATYADQWARATEGLPENGWPITTEQALTTLKSLRGKTGLTWGASSHTNPNWGNTTHFINVENVKVILKSNQQRTSIEGDRVKTFNNNVRYEVLAFAIDRYLGINLAPPAVMLDSDRAAILYTPGNATSFKNFASSPTNLVHATHIRFLDALLSNGDREAFGNIIITSSGRPVAIDFDLSMPYYPYFGFNSGMGYVSNHVLIDPSRKLGKFGPMPGVVSRRVMEKLEKLDEAQLKKIASEVGLKLSESEIKNVLGSADYLKYSVGQWVRLYGETLTYVP